MTAEMHAKLHELANEQITGQMVNFESILGRPDLDYKMAYWIGVRDGERLLAREILKDMQE